MPTISTPLELMGAYKMWEDPIVKEIHKFREEHAKKFNYNLEAIFEDLKERERKSGRKIISLPIKRKVGALEASIKS